MTIDAWIAPSSFGGRIMDKITAFSADGFLLDLPGDRVRMIVGNNLLSSNHLIPAGMFTHVAGVFDGVNLSLYVNGEFSGQLMSNTPTIPVNSNPLRIGADSTGGSLLQRHDRRAAHLQPRAERGRDSDAGLADLELRLRRGGVTDRGAPAPRALRPVRDGRALSRPLRWLVSPLLRYRRRRHVPFAAALASGPDHQHAGTALIGAPGGALAVVLRYRPGLLRIEALDDLARFSRIGSLLVHVLRANQAV